MLKGNRESGLDSINIYWLGLWNNYTEGCKNISESYLLCLKNTFYDLLYINIIWKPKSTYFHYFERREAKNINYFFASNANLLKKQNEIFCTENMHSIIISEREREREREMAGERGREQNYISVVNSN